VKVSAAVRQIAHVSGAEFTVCPSASGAVCGIGTLPTGQADELQASVKVARAAAAGNNVTLTATASGERAVSFHASASVLITAAPQSSPGAASPSPSPSLSLPAATVPALPGSLTTLPGTGSTVGNPVSLFPTVTPGTSATPNPTVTGPAGRHPRRINAAATSAILPLDPRLIGGQLAGLAVLAGAIAIAIARLSLRTPRPQNSKAADK
jgi:hypothetical protein